MEINTIEQLKECIERKTPLLMGYDGFIYGCILSNINIQDTIPYHWDLQDKILSNEITISNEEELFEYINKDDNFSEFVNPLTWLFLDTSVCVEMYSPWDYENDEYSNKMNLVPVNKDFEYWIEDGIRPGDSNFIRMMEPEELKNFKSKIRKLKRHGINV